MPFKTTEAERAYRATPKQRERKRAYMARYHEKNRQILLEKQKARWHSVQKFKTKQNRDQRIKRRYGLSSDDFDALLASQGGLCAICDDPLRDGGKYTHVDHCHKTNIVRGLLCARCNIALGNFGDDPKRLRRAIKYLQRSSARDVAFSPRAVSTGMLNLPFNFN